MRFHGVATKYLENYLGWRRMLERYKTGITPWLCLKEAVGRPAFQQLIQTQPLYLAASTLAQLIGGSPQGFLDVVETGELYNQLFGLEFIVAVIRQIRQMPNVQI